ncbi:MAG: acyltransferase family protein [Vitreimonas sp.]
MTSGAERFHALDAVRGGALVLGVFFHAAMSFMPGPQIWIAMDSARSTELSVLFFVLHIFRMTVFFVLAGFFARMLLERRGVGGFIANRATRILAPLVAFWPLVMAAIIAVVIWVAIRVNGGVAPEGPPPPPLTVEAFPLTHLWFLYVLLFFYAGALALRGLVSLLDRGGALRARLLDPVVRAVGGWGAPVVLALPVAAALYLTPDWYLWFGIPAADTGLVPKPATLIVYGIAFGFGWLLNRQPQILQTWGECWGAYVGPAIGATITCLMMVGVTPLLTPAEQNLRTLAYAALYAFACWAWTIAIVGFAVRNLAGHSPARRYLADASYWIYIVHLPIVMALQAAFALYDWPWFAKYPLILAIAFAIMLASYQWFVRYSFIGAILNGKKQKPAKARAARARLAAAK